MKHAGNPLSIAFGTRAMKALALAGLLAAGAAGGAMDAFVRFGRAAPEPVSTAVADAGAADVAPKAPKAVEAVLAAVTGAADGSPAWDLPNLDHPRVDYWVERFTTDKRDEFARFLGRSGRYTPMISAKLAERGLPQDLIYLAMIESGFNPTAYSHAHASGLWQFISGTATRYGLDINRAVDERNDPVRATDAALDYLTDLHDRFGSWYLAAAGYNTGENRVGRIMRQVTGSEKGTEESYYRIWSRLPRETRDYVPLMVAAARIAKEPARYGFDEVDIAPPMRYDEVTVPPASQLAAIAEAAGTTVKELKQLNPHFKLSRTRNDMESTVRIPDRTAARFAANWPKVKESTKFAEAEPQPQTKQYRVRRGDNLTLIARRHGVSIRQIKVANGLRSDRIRAGAVLRIPA